MKAKVLSFVRKKTARKPTHHRPGESRHGSAHGLMRQKVVAPSRGGRANKPTPNSLLYVIKQDDCNTAKILISLVVISITSDLFWLRVYLHEMQIPGPLITLALALAALGIFRQRLGALGWTLLSFSPLALKLIATVVTLTTVLGISLMQGKQQSWPLIFILMVMTLLAIQAHRTGGNNIAKGEGKTTENIKPSPDALGGAPAEYHELRSRLVLALLCGPSIASRVASLGVLSWLPLTPEIFSTYLASVFLVFAAAIADSAAIQRYGPM